MNTSMKTLLISLATATLLTACATGPTAYGPAQGRGLGFSAQQIEKDRFQVSFTGRNIDEARNLALLRAAEVTQQYGFTHFRVVGSDTRGNENRRSPVSSSIGIGIGSGGYRRGTSTNVGIGIGINDVARALQGNKVTASLEIILGGVVGSGGDNVYEAESIIGSLRPKVFTE